MDKEIVFANRLRRHRLTIPIGSRDDYVEFCRQMQPVSPQFYSCPGEPPTLQPRTSFNDRKVTGDLRAERKLVKGRFLNGGVGYVFADELEIYVNAFRKPLNKISYIDQDVLDVIQGCGPVSAGLIKEETGFLSKEIIPSLHKLQKACIVFEDQSDSDWERPWDLFEREFPDVEIDESLRLPAVKAILSRVLRVNVFLTIPQLKSWSGLGIRLLKTAVQELLAEKAIISITIDGLGDGYVLPEDVDVCPEKPERSVFMLHKADPIVKLHAHTLKALFDGEVLQYLLIDGELTGAVMGHVRIGPHDVDDIQLLLPEDECDERKTDILNVVSKHYHAPRSRILSYCGKRIK